MEQNEYVSTELMSKGYGIIPKVVTTDVNLTVEAKAIYAYLASYSGTGMFSYPSTNLMLEHLGMSMNRYLKHRKLLEERGYLTIKRKKKDNLLSKNYYYLNETPSRCVQNGDIEIKSLENKSLENEHPNSNSSKSNSFNNNRSDSSPSKKKEETNIYKTIITYLNEKADRNFSPTNKTTQSQINARMTEGRTVEDFKAVIDLKVEQWKHDDKMSTYLRPSTLFSPKNFENYVNEALDASFKEKIKSSAAEKSTRSFSIDDFK